MNNGYRYISNIIFAEAIGMPSPSLAAQFPWTESSIQDQNLIEKKGRKKPIIDLILSQ